MMPVLTRTTTPTESGARAPELDRETGYVELEPHGTIHVTCVGDLKTQCGRQKASLDGLQRGRYLPASEVEIQRVCLVCAGRFRQLAQAVIGQRESNRQGAADEAGVAEAIAALRAVALDALDRLGNTSKLVEPDLSKWAAARDLAHRSLTDKTLQLPDGMNRSLVLHFRAIFRAEAAFAATRDLARRLGVPELLDG